MMESYCKSLKTQICLENPTKSCCEKSLLDGILLTTGTILDDHIEVLLAGSDAYVTVPKLIEDVYHASVELKSRRGASAFLLKFQSKSALKYITSLKATETPPAHECKNCKQFFLRGVFLSCGYVKNPDAGFSLEFLPRYHTEMLRATLEELDCVPHISTRKGNPVLYYHTSEGVGDVVASMGFLDSFFELQNEYFKKQLSQQTNRQNNCTLGNLNRSAASKSGLLIRLEKLKEQSLFSTLPDDLKEIAELRLNNPDLSLTQLAMKLTTPLTKSGLNHRLKRLEAWLNEQHIK